jgi:hypothetical protein
MANTDQPDAGAEQPHPDTEIEHEEQAEQQESRQAFAGLWVILAVIAVVIVGAFLVLSYHARTPALSPGKPSSVAMLGDSG